MSDLFDDYIVPTAHPSLVLVSRPPPTDEIAGSTKAADPPRGPPAALKTGARPAGATDAPEDPIAEDPIAPGPPEAAAPILTRTRASKQAATRTGTSQQAPARRKAAQQAVRQGSHSPSEPETDEAEEEAPVSKKRTRTRSDHPRPPTRPRVRKTRAAQARDHGDHGEPSMRLVPVSELKMTALRKLQQMHATRKAQPLVAFASVQNVMTATIFAYQQHGIESFVHEAGDSIYTARMFLGETYALDGNSIMWYEAMHAWNMDGLDKDDCMSRQTLELPTNVVTLSSGDMEIISHAAYGFHHFGAPEMNMGWDTSDWTSITDPNDEGYNGLLDALDTTLDFVYNVVTVLGFSLDSIQRIIDRRAPGYLLTYEQVAELACKGTHFKYDVEKLDLDPLAKAVKHYKN